MERPPRIPPILAGLAIVIALGAVLVLADSPDPLPEAEGKAEPPPPYEIASETVIAERLAGLRELEFKMVPEVRMLSAVEWRKRTRKAAAAGPSGERERRETAAVEDFLKLSGLATADFEVEQATEGVGELIGGFYRPKANRLVLVENPLQGPRGEERVIAHEFEHALQDQNYPDALELGTVTGEPELALSALVEGDASVVERRYARRYLEIGTIDADKSLLSPTNLAVGLPPALVASVRFPYTSGADFVAALQQRGGWPLVDRAFRDPPTTTEQILHPGKWIAGEDGVEVSIADAAALGPGWISVAEVESGELDAIVILASGVPADIAERAAKGWDGGVFEALRLSGGGPECAGACRQRRAAVLAYRWGSERDALEFAAAAGHYLEARLSSGRRDGSTFPIGDAAASIGIGARTTSIAYAPTPELSIALAEAAVRPAGAE